MRTDAREIGNWEKADLVGHDDGTVSIRTYHGKFVCCMPGEGAGSKGAVQTNRDAVGDWETLTLVFCEAGKVAFRTHHGTYLTFCPPGSDVSVGGLQTDRDAVGAWEKFRMSGLRIALRSHHGYLCATGREHVGEGAVIQQERIGNWERFTLVEDRGKVAFLTYHGTYLTALPAPAGTSGAWNTNRDAAGGWETFDLVPTEGKWALRTHLGRYMSAGPPDRPQDQCGLATDRRAIGDWERFQVEAK